MRMSLGRRGAESGAASSLFREDKAHLGFGRETAWRLTGGPVGEVAEDNPEALGITQGRNTASLGAGTQERLFEGCL